MFTDVLVILFDLFDHIQSLFFMKGPYFSHFSLQALMVVRLPTRHAGYLTTYNGF